MKSAIISLICLVCGMAAGMLLSRFCPVFKPQTEVSIQTDTLYVRDTIIERSPVYVTDTRIDTMLVALTDTVTVSDTVYVRIDREQKHYKGDDYEAWISGYRPALDSIHVFSMTEYVTVTQTESRKPKRWGIGIQTGYGMSLPDGKPTFSPYIGIGISYDLIRW